MTLRPHPLLLSIAVLLVALTVAIGAPAAHAASDGGSASAQADASTAVDSGEAASKRRSESSAFEREKLDGKAFDDSSSSESDSTKSSGGSGSIFRFVFGLAVVIGVIYGVHWLLKRWGQSRMQGLVGTSGIIDVVATTQLAQGRALHVVRVGGELVLVGATEQAITRISDLDPSIVNGAPAPVLGMGEFQTMLDGALVEVGPGTPTALIGPAPSSSKEPFVKRFIDNLRLTTAR